MEHRRRLRAWALWAIYTPVTIYRRSVFLVEQQQETKERRVLARGKEKKKNLLYFFSRVKWRLLLHARHG